MNMSVSPVKPPLSSTTLAVPSATVTNLSKSALPTNNNFGALNLVPESKGGSPAPAAPTTPEKSVADSCAKAPQCTPTSNGTVSPLPDTGQSVPSATTIPSIQNCNEKTESAQNLTTNNATSKTDNAVEEPPKIKADVDKKKDEKKEEKKPNTETKESSSDSKATPVKDVTAQNASSNETTSCTDGPSVKKSDTEEKKKDEKKPEANRLPSESVPVENATPTPAKTEPSVEPAATKVVQEEKKPAPPTKKEDESAKTEAEPVPKKKAESSVAAEPAPAKTDATPKTASAPKATKRKAKAPVESIVEEENADGRKSKRTRLPTQPYQSPIPELQLIAKLNTPVKTPGPATEKIIAFYKNEFLAVRNPEGSFYICQTFQNIHRSSSKIKIRWFTNLPQNIYTPDFYDTTEFDCILTNVTMSRVEKDRWKLPDAEQGRIENILKRALDVEKGVVEQPSVTEEHPDGLDLSLYKDEAQLQKRKKKVATTPPKKASPPEPKKTTTTTTTTTTTATATATKKSKRVTKSPQKSATSSATPVKKSPRVSSYVNRDSTTADTKSKAGGEKATKPTEKPTKATVTAAAAKKDKKDKKKKNSKASTKKQAGSAAATSKSGADNVSSKMWEPSVKASNSSKVVLSLRKEDSSPTKSSVAVPETKGTKRTSSVSLRASAAAAAAAAAATTPTTSPAAKRRKEEPKTSPSASTTTTTTTNAANTTTTAAAAASANVAATTGATTEKSGKVRNAGSAVSAKINSAAIRTTKEKERKAATPTSQRKK